MLKKKINKFHIRISLCQNDTSIINIFFFFVLVKIEFVVANIIQMIRDFGRDLSSVLRYSLNRRQARVERVIGRFAVSYINYFY